MASKNSLLVLLACVLFATILGGRAAETPSSAPVAAQEVTAQTPTTSPAPGSTPTTSPAQGSTSTTSPAPVTTHAPPSTTSPVPVTTHAPTTTPSPVPVTTPAPSDGKGNWTVVDGNVTYIIAQMAVSTKVAYPLQAANKTANVDVAVPVSAKASGTRGANSQSVKISWGSNDVEFTFVKNDTTNMYYVSHISLSLLADNKTFPNISTDFVNTSFNLESSSLEFKTNVNQSYRCIREESLPLSKAGSNFSAVLVLNHVQLQAFRTENNAVFGTAQDCDLDTPDIVPIAVGCALAALVFVVLVAYLVGRRRSQARGYLSM